MTRDYWTRWRLPPKISRGFLVALPLLLLLRAQLEKLAIWHILTCCTCVPHVVKLDKKSCFLVLEEELLAPDLGRETTEMLSQSAKPTSQSGQAQVSRMPHWMPPWSALVKSAAICKDVARCYKKHKKTQLYLPPSVASKSITCQGTRHPKQKACCSARRSQHFSGTNAATSLPDKI